ncbi:chloride channel protein [Marinobacter fuscus]|uniref:Chloride channel protein n=1 Tax=Marinobacter fuscus TaxID=2109942 RepID=A0A2T1KQT4_9GAMM|nr:chloride channel protein [Marinobacter fuscus]PSF12388.1 chloride channel protein [Marinobacter fuscus]
MRNPLRVTFERLIPSFRRRLSDVDALPQLAVLGLLSGIITGAVILLFRFAIEWPLANLLPGGNSEAFESLAPLTRGMLPLAGAVALAFFVYHLPAQFRKVGVVYIMERLNYHQGYVSFKSVLIQFISGVATVVSGQSAGREGPAIHLGSGCSSLLGQWLKLPNNSIRTLVACGCAAAISASFNTPVSGVIFAMEAIMMEYTIAGFTPIILAAVSSAIVMQLVYGPEPAFTVPPVTMSSLAEIPWILVMAIICGIAATLFIRLVSAMARFHHRPLPARIIAAGILMIPFAILVPETMGISYDTVNDAISGQLGLSLLIVIGLAKLVITSTTIGLGMPSGVIGPTIVIGASLGGAMGLIGAAIMPEMASSVSFYSMLGMGAMMGAILQTPLAALMTLLELTHNPNIMLPGMLIITIASLITSEVFGEKPLFLTILKNQGLSYQNSPVVQALRRVSVGAIMERSLLRMERHLSLAEAKKALKSEPKWLLVDGSNGPTALLPAADLARYLEDAEKGNHEEGTALPDLIDLMEIPANRRDVAPVQYQATLEEALNQFDSTQAEALYVQRHVAPMIQRVYGVVLHSDIESYYQYRRS